MAQGGRPVMNTDADEQKLYNIVAVLDKLAEERQDCLTNIVKPVIAAPRVAKVIIVARTAA